MDDLQLVSENLELKRRIETLYNEKQNLQATLEHRLAQVQVANLQLSDKDHEEWEADNEKHIKQIRLLEDMTNAQASDIEKLIDERENARKEGEIFREEVDRLRTSTFTQALTMDDLVVKVAQAEEKAKATDELVSLQQHFAELELKYENLEMEKNAEIEALSGRAAQYEAKLDETMTQLLQKEQDFNTVSIERDSSVSELSRVKASLASFQSQSASELEDLRDRSRSLSTAKQRLEGDLKGNMDRIQEYARQLQELRLEKVELMKSLQMAELDTDDLRKDIHSAKTARDDSEDQLLQSESTLASLRVDYENRGVELAKLIQYSNDLSGQFDNTAQALTEVMIEKESLLDQVSKLTSSLEEEKSQHIDALTSFDAQLKQLEQAKSESDCTVKVLQGQLEDKMQSEQTLEQQIRDSQATVSALSQEKDELNTNLETQKTQIEEQNRLRELLEQEGENLQARNAELLDNLNTLKTESQQTIHGLEKQLKQCSVDLSSLRSTLDEEMKKVVSLKTEVQQGENEIDSLKTRVQQGENEVDSLKKQVQQGESEIDSLKTQVQQGEKESASLRTQVQQGESEIDSLKTQVQQGENEVDSLKTQVQQGESEIDSLKTQVQQGESEIDSLKTQVRQGEKESASLRTQVQQGESEIDSFKTQVQQGEKESASLRTQVQHGESEIDSLKTQVQQGEKVISSLQIQLKQGRKDSQQTIGSMQSLAEQIKLDSQKNITLLKKDVDEMRQQNSDLQQTIAAQKVQRKQMKKDSKQAILALKSSLEELARRAEDLQQKVVSLEDELSNSRETNIQFQQQEKDLQAAVSSLKTQLADIQDGSHVALAQLESKYCGELDGRDQTIQSQSFGIEKLICDLKESEKHISELKSSLANSTRENTDLRTQLETANIENEETSQELVDLQAELSRLSEVDSSDVADLEAELQRAQTQLEAEKDARQRSYEINDDLTQQLREMIESKSQQTQETYESPDVPPMDTEKAQLYELIEQKTQELNDAVQAKSNLAQEFEQQSVMLRDTLANCSDLKQQVSDLNTQLQTSTDNTSQRLNNMSQEHQLRQAEADKIHADLLYKLDQAQKQLAASLECAKETEKSKDRQLTEQHNKQLELKSNLLEAKNTISDLESQLQDNTAELNRRIATALERADRKTRTLEEELNEKAGELVEEENRLKLCRSQRDQLRNRLQELEQQRENETDSMNVDLAGMRKQMSDHAGETAALLTKLQTQAASIDELTHTKQQMQIVLDGLRNDLSSAQADLNDKKLELNKQKNVQSQLYAVQDKLNEATKAIENLSRLKSSLEEQVAQLQDSNQSDANALAVVEDLHAVNKNLEDRLEQSDTYCNSLQSKCELAKQHADGLEQELQRVTSKLYSMTQGEEQEKQRLNDTSSHLRSQLNEVKRRAHDIEDELENKLAEAERNFHTTNALKDRQLKDAANLKSQLEIQLAQVEKQLQDMKSEPQLTDAYNQPLQELQKIQDQNQLLKSQMKDIDAENRRTLEDLKTQHQASENQLQSALRDLTQRDSDLSEVQAQLEHEQGQKELLRREVKRLQNTGAEELVEIKKMNSDLRAQLSHVNNTQDDRDALKKRLFELEATIADRNQRLRAQSEALEDLLREKNISNGQPSGYSAVPSDTTAPHVSLMDLCQALSGKDQEIGRLKEGISSLETQREMLRLQVDHCNELIQAKDQEINHLHSAHPVELKKYIDEKNTQLGHAFAENSRKQEHFQLKQRNYIQQLQDRLLSMSKQLEKMKAHKPNYNNSTESVTSVPSEPKSLDSALKQLAAAHQQLNQNTVEREELIKALAGERSNNQYLSGKMEASRRIAAAYGEQQEDISKMLEERGHSNGVLNDLQHQLTNLHEQYEQAQIEITNLQRELAVAQGETLSKLSDSHDVTIDEIRTQLDGERQDRQRLAELNTQLMQQLQMLGSQELLQEPRKHAQKRHDSSLNDTKETENTVDIPQQQQPVQDDQTNILKQRLYDTNAANKQLQDQLKQTQGHLEKAESNLLTKSEELANAINRIQALRSENEEKLVEIKPLQSRNEALQKQIVTLQEQVSAQNKLPSDEDDELRNRLQKSLHDQSALQQELETLRDQIASTKCQHGSDADVTDHKNLAASILEKIHTSRQEEAETIDNRYYDTVRRLRDTEKHRDVLNNQIFSLKNKLNQANTRLLVLEESRKQLASITKICDQLRSENAKYKALIGEEDGSSSVKVFDLQSQLHLSKDRNRSLYAVIRTLRMKLRELQQEQRSIRTVVNEAIKRAMQDNSRLAKGILNAIPHPSVNRPTPQHMLTASLPPSSVVPSNNQMSNVSTSNNTNQLYNFQEFADPQLQRALQDHTVTSSMNHVRSSSQRRSQIYTNSLPYSLNRSNDYLSFGLWSDTYRKQSNPVQHTVFGQSIPVANSAQENNSIASNRSHITNPVSYPDNSYRSRSRRVPPHLNSVNQFQHPQDKRRS